MKPLAKAPPSTERAIMIRIRAELATMPGVRVWRNNTGVDLTRGVRYGLAVGSADLIGVVMMPGGIGRFFALEVKRPGEQPTAEQRRWMSVVRTAGGFAAVVRSVQDAIDAVDHARTR